MPHVTLIIGLRRDVNMPEGVDIEGIGYDGVVPGETTDRVHLQRHGRFKECGLVPDFILHLELRTPIVREDDGWPKQDRIYRECGIVTLNNVNV
ncbi:MAG: hypothetical protein AAF217_08455, partial [Pseudomonadota bacterium]